MSGAPQPRAQLETRIYWRVLVECRFALNNILYHRYPPQHAEYVLEQIQRALEMQSLTQEQLEQLALDVQAVR